MEEISGKVLYRLVLGVRKQNNRQLPFYDRRPHIININIFRRVNKTISSVCLKRYYKAQ